MDFLLTQKVIGLFTPSFILAMVIHLKLYQTRIVSEYIPRD